MDLNYGTEPMNLMVYGVQDSQNDDIIYNQINLLILWF